MNSRSIPTIPASRRRGVAPLLMLAAVITLAVVAGGFVLSVCQRPSRTPLLMLTGSYEPTWDLNHWVEEDRQRMMALDNGSLGPRDLCDPATLRAGFWDQADHTLRESLHSCPVNQACLIYIHLHTAVDGHGVPCLIPPGAEPLSPETWVPLQRLIQHIEQCQPARPRSVVLLIEGGKLENWLPAGILENSFDDALAGVVEQTNQRLDDWNLIALSSAARNQRSASNQSAGVKRGNVFSKAIASGLTGQADGSGHEGIRDGWITVSELHHFIQQVTIAVTSEEFGRVQTPTLHCSVAGEQTIICSTSLQPIQFRTLPVNAPDQAALQVLDENQRQLHRLRDLQVDRLDPITWAETLRFAQAISEAHYGGAAAHARLAAWQQALQAKFEYWEQQLADREKVLCESPYYIHLASSRKIWKQVAAAPAYEEVQALLANAEPVDVYHLPELRTLLEREQLRCWQDPRPIARYAIAQAMWLETLRRTPPRAIKFTGRHQHLVAVQRRQLFDCLLADGAGTPVARESGLDEQNRSTLDANQARIDARLRAFEAQVQRSERALREVIAALAIFDRACLTLPAFCLWADELQSVHFDNPELVALNAGEQSPQKLCFRATQVFHRLNKSIQSLAQIDGMTPDELPELAFELNNTLADLQEIADGAIDRITTTKTVSPRDSRAVLVATLRNEFLIAPEQPAELLHGKLLELSHETSEPSRLLTGNAAHLESSATSLNDYQTPNGDASRLYWTPEHRAASRRLSLHLSTLPNMVGMEGSLAPSQSLRAAALALRTRAQENLFASLYMHLRQQQLLLVADIVLDDFWNASQNETPYFASTAKELLDAAEQWEPADQALQAELLNLRNRLADRLAASDAAQLGAMTAIPTLEKLRSANVRLLDADQLTRFPAGLVALEAVSLVNTAEGNATTAKQTLSSLASLTLPDSEELDTDSDEICGDVESGDAASLQPQKQPLSQSPAGASMATVSFAPARLQLTFRGHTYPLTANQAGFAEQRVTVRQQPTAATKISLVRGSELPRAVMFVVDCSASMDEAIAGERLTPDAFERSKLDAARWAVLSMFHQLRDTMMHVGLTLYGHRMAVDAKGVQILAQQKYLAAFPFDPTLQPYEDVEVVLPAGRISDVERSLVRQRFDHLQPWGQSPLHLALQQTIRSINQLGANIAKDIVVISDGQDYQFNPPAESVVGMEAVISAARQHGVRIHLIGFGIPAEQRVAAAADFQRLASATNGKSVHDVHQANDLLSELKRFTHEPTAMIAEVNGRNYPIELGSTVADIEVSQANTPLTLSLQDETFELAISPGSQLDLQWDPNTGQLRSRPFQTGILKQQQMVSPGGQAVPAIVAIHDLVNPTVNDRRQYLTASSAVPAVSGSANLSGTRPSSSQPLLLSLQRADAGVAVRPTFLWAEVTPLKSADEAVSHSAFSRYQTANVSWLSGTPCPVASFACESWPEDANYLDVRVWCTDEQVPVAASLRATPDVSYIEKIVGQSGPGVEVQWSRHDQELMVKIQYDLNQQGRSRGTMAPWVVAPREVEPLEVATWYSPAGDLSLHRFRFSKHQGDRAILFDLMSVEQIKKLAASNEKSLVVPAKVD
ncbi:vWA domain-containing protein [Planctomycetaceae bacterium SH139]